MRVRKREASSEACGNLITRTLTHHARSKRSEINSIYICCSVLRTSYRKSPPALILRVLRHSLRYVGDIVTDK